MSVQIVKDIKEGIKRELMQITTGHLRTRTNRILTEKFDQQGKHIVGQPLSVSDYPEAPASSDEFPDISLQIIKAEEDKTSGRMRPPFGLEVKLNADTSSTPLAYDIILKGDNLLTTNGGGGSTATISHFQTAKITSSHYLRILSGENIGTYQITSVTMSGNGPHTINLSSTLVDTLPDFNYNPDTGVILFDSYVDLSTVEAADIFTDSESNTFAIAAVDPTSYAFRIAVNQEVRSGSGGTVTRTGDVLKNDDAGATVYYLILDSDEIETRTLPDASTTNRQVTTKAKNWDIPFNFLFYVKVESKELDDHDAMLTRILEIVNPPRSAIYVDLRRPESAESYLNLAGHSGRDTIKLDSVEGFIVGETVYLTTDTSVGESFTIEKIDTTKNAIKLDDTLSVNYPLSGRPKLISNIDRCLWNRFVIEHNVEDSLTEQIFVHRFLIKIEGWMDARVRPYSTVQNEIEYDAVHFIHVDGYDLDGDEDWYDIDV